MTDQPADWDCTAYGPKGRDVGALCFFAELNQRVCASLLDCHTKMSAERERAFTRIHELAETTGDPTWKFLAESFTHPDQLLNANDDETERGPTDR